MKKRLLFLVSLIALSISPVYAQPQEAATPPKKVSSGVMEGLLRKRVDPHYPDRAKAQHIQGDVILSAVIDKEGNIKSLKVASGDPVLAGAALEAVKQWKYRPYVDKDDRPIDVETAITVRFHM
jgi:protein TonB